MAPPGPDVTPGHMFPMLLQSADPNQGCTPPPLRKHGRNPKSQVKTAVRCPPRASTRPCMRVIVADAYSPMLRTYVTAMPGHNIVSHGWKSHQSKQHGVAMCGTMSL